jgi:dimethylargininase
MILAITRQISPRFAECELTHIERVPIDLPLARQQHEQYVQALRQLGCQVIELPPEADLPDSVFVEDTAIILPEIAIITRPGADSRKPEVESIAPILSRYRPLARIQAPATLDGGDVLVLGKKIFVGLSTRSNHLAITQLQTLLADYGYDVDGVHLHDCLHLKSAVTRLDDQTLLINRAWVDTKPFETYHLIDVDPDEPFAANCLPIGGVILYSAAFPKTLQKIKEQGFSVQTVDVSELAKAEGAITCCSLILTDAASIA